MNAHACGGGGRPTRGSDAWAAFAIGVAGGVVGGLSLLSFVGLPSVALIAIVGGFGLRPRPFSAAGVLIGWAGAWVVVLAGAQARCSSPCTTDVTPWMVFAVGLAAVGVTLIVLGIRRPPWAARAARSVGTWLRWSPVRVAGAVVLGVVAGLYASTLLVVGWGTAIPIWIWFAWRHREPKRRPEVLWLTAAALLTFAALVRR